MNSQTRTSSLTALTTLLATAWATTILFVPPMLWAGLS